MRHLDWIARDVCTLPTAQRPLREQEFDALLFDALLEVERVSPTRLHLVLGGPRGLADRVQDLAARETECCSFFAFTVQRLQKTDAPDPEWVELDAEVPAAYREVLDAMADRAQTTITTSEEHG